MTDILSTTTSILDLLVPHESTDRARVLSAVRAVLDLSERPSRWGARLRGEHGVRVGRVDLVGDVCLPKPAKEKPQPAAPKARHGNKPSEERVAWKKLVPIMLAQRQMTPAALRQLLHVPYAKKSTLTAVLKELSTEGVVEATGSNSARLYRLIP